MILTSLAEWKRTTQHANCLAHCVDLADGPEYKNQLQPLWMKIIAQCLQSFGIFVLQTTKKTTESFQNQKMENFHQDGILGHPESSWDVTQVSRRCHAGVTGWDPDPLEPIRIPSSTFGLVVFETLHFDVHLSYFQESEQPSIIFEKINAQNPKLPLHQVWMSGLQSRQGS